jgi:protein TonB
MSAVLLPGGLPAGSEESSRTLRRPTAAVPPSPATGVASPLHRQVELLPPSGSHRGSGIAVVIGVHLLVAWALSSGLAKEAIAIIKKPIQAAIIPEVLPPPPPPPPPPKVERLPEPPKFAPPPPAYVAPPEVVTTAPPAPVIQAVQSETPKAPPPAVATAPAPVPAPPPVPAVVKREISLACPGYEAQLANALEEAVERVGQVGVVNALITIRGNQVVEVVPQSGPQAYHKYVVAALKRLRCTAGGADTVQASIPLRFE